MHDNYIQPQWLAPPPVKAVSTTRCQGFSQAPFNQFNLATHVEDDPIAVVRNRQQLMHDLQLTHMPIWLQQVHGTHVIELTEPAYSSPLSADACITRQPHIVCAVMTADCLPILICNRQGNEIAAIHAGWRGLLAGIIENTVGTMHSNPSDLMAWFGPAIGPKHFEINADIATLFINKHSELSLAISKPFPERWFADLFLLAELTLKYCDVNTVFSDHLCTYTDQQRFYSHRRDHGKTGRMASLIWLES